MSGLQTANQALNALERDKKRLKVAKRFLSKPWNERRKVCPCCALGLPLCADFETIPQAVAHRITCIEYRFASEVCGDCERQFDPDLVDMRLAEKLIDES